jgi:hypothetical protein
LSERIRNCHHIVHQQIQPAVLFGTNTIKQLLNLLIIPMIYSYRYTLPASSLYRCRGFAQGTRQRVATGLKRATCYVYRGTLLTKYLGDTPTNTSASAGN